MLALLAIDGLCRSYPGWSPLEVVRAPRRLVNDLLLLQNYRATLRPTDG